MGAGQLLTITQISVERFLPIRQNQGATLTLFSGYFIQQTIRQVGVCVIVSEDKDRCFLVESKGSVCFENSHYVDVGGSGKSWNFLTSLMPKTKSP